MSLNVREWTYLACGLICERNAKAALNVLIAGLAGLALVSGINLVCIWVFSGCSHGIGVFSLYGGDNQKDAVPVRLRMTAVVVGCGAVDRDRLFFMMTGNSYFTG